MKDGLLLVERIILESLSTGEKSLEELIKDTGLRKNLLLSLISNLYQDHIILREGNTYLLNEENKKNWLPKVNSKESVRGEIKELFLTMVNNHFEDLEYRSCGLKMKKIHVNKRDEKILQAHFKNLHDFVENLEKYPDKKAKSPTYEKKVIFWGQSDYGSLIETSLVAC
ncbi:MAG: hypothetical protein KC493_13355 [Bacteriovoracaceae bacterium]|nr:hypothetical protein [Bacteriovoracaceae bacterium]